MTATATSARPRRRRDLTPWAMLAPAIVLFTLFMAAPIVFFGARMTNGDFGPAFYVLSSHICVAALILFALLANSRHALARTPA